MFPNVVRGLCVAAALLSAGCQYAVKIEAPKAGTQDRPVTELKVKFHKDFEPGTFNASLSGTTITNLFSPPPAPGGFSFAYIKNPNYMDYNHANNKGLLNQQLLRVEGKFKAGVKPSGITSYIESDEVEFSPPSVRIFRGGGTTVTFNHDLTLKERETITATVFTEKAPAEPLTVIVKGSPRVSLNDQPAGQDITLVIPRNDRRVDFRVRGVEVSGEAFLIRPLADGYSSAAAAGYVRRAD